MFDHRAKVMRYNRHFNATAWSPSSDVPLQNPVANFEFEKELWNDILFVVVVVVVAAFLAFLFSGIHLLRKTKSLKSMNIFWMSAHSSVQFCRQLQSCETRCIFRCESAPVNEWPLRKHALHHTFVRLRLRVWNGLVMESTWLPLERARHMGMDQLKFEWHALGFYVRQRGMRLGPGASYVVFVPFKNRHPTCSASLLRHLQPSGRTAEDVSALRRSRTTLWDQKAEFIIWFRWFIVIHRYFADVKIPSELLWVWCVRLERVGTISIGSDPTCRGAKLVQRPLGKHWVWGIRAPRNSKRAGDVIRAFGIPDIFNHS